MSEICREGECWFVPETGLCHWCGKAKESDVSDNWYVLGHNGILTLCRDESDARNSESEYDRDWPRNAQHVATQLVRACVFERVAAELERVKRASVLVWVGDSAEVPGGRYNKFVSWGKYRAYLLLEDCAGRNITHPLDEHETEAEAQAACQAHHQARYEQMRGAV